MDMSIFLKEIEYSVSNTLPVVWKEAEEVNRLQGELQPLTVATQHGYQQAQAFALDDDDGLATMIHWETYFGPDKERYHKEKETESAIQRMALHTLARGQSAGSVLQDAKTGLSLVYGEPNKWPQWLAIGTQSFGNVIRHARNQSMHWDTPQSIKEPLKQCFERMAAEISPVFSDYDKRSLAFEVLSHLKWQTFDDFKRDMLKT